MKKTSGFTLFLKRHSLVYGIILMFLLTWPVDLANSRVLPIQFPLVVYLFLGWGFVLASLIMTRITLGQSAVIALLNQYLIWRIHWKWYLTAFLLFPAIFTLAVLLNAAFTQSLVDFNGVFAHKIFGESANLPLLILPFFLFDFISNGEEMGWRGYVLPRLQAKHSTVVSSLILGLIWGFWHLPKYMAPGNTGSFGWMMVKMLADAVIYTWLYNKTSGSLLLTTIMHTAGNTAGVFLPMANTRSGEQMDVYVLAVVIEIIFAFLFATVSGLKRLSKNEGTLDSGAVL
jgi:membrane protease YdiL (CAAX protease family)